MARRPRRGAPATVRRARGRGCPATSTSSRPASASPSASKNGRAAAIASRCGPVAQLEHVAQQHQPIDARRAACSRGARSSAAAQQVGAGEAAEVQVGDDQRAHRGSPSAIAGAMSARPRSERSGGPGPRPTASRIGFGSMKRTSSRITSNSEMSCTPRARKKSTSSATRFSGALAPEEMPTTRRPSSHCSLDFAGVVDQVGLGAAVARDLDEAHRVGGVARADHEHQVAERGHLLDGRLAVGGGVADVIRARADDRREALAQARDDRRSFRRRRASSG